MTFSPEQIDALKADLNRAHVAQREQAGRKLSYIEGWWAIAEANRIFGFDRWHRETVELRQLGEPRVVGDKCRVGYMARVRIEVFAGDEPGAERCVIREGCGFGSGIDKDVDQAHESALKEAETDAMKRALMTFGNPFGLALYDKTQAHVSDGIAGRSPPNEAPSMPMREPSGRKSSAQAKRDGDDAKIKGEINACDAGELKAWRENFDVYTAHVPLSWLTSIHDMLELRQEELDAADRIGPESDEMDAAFRGAVGGASSGGVPRDGHPLAAE